MLCPNGLVKNWVEDAHKVTQGKWNIIPITKDSYRLWGDERLTKMLLKAPPNTIVVVGLSVLKLDKYPVVIGTHVEMVSETLEFIKKFGFDYVAIDESHRVKNPKSATHKTVKQLCVASSVKYIPRDGYADLEYVARRCWSGSHVQLADLPYSSGIRRGAYGLRWREQERHLPT